MDHYQTLGVPRDASMEAIRDAFRELTRLHHPDAAADAKGTKFQAIVAAYDVLRDAESRARYDSELAGAGHVRTPHFTWSNIAQPRGSGGGARDEKPDLDAMIDAYFGRWNDPA